MLEQRLRRMRRIPLLLLLGMAAVFVLTLPAAPGWSEWLHAFAEAAMVGGLADWFAVSALFRHPMGLPIPHTAIVPRRKDEIGASLARFVADHFLVEDALRPKLSALAPSQRLARWLLHDAARERLAAYGMRLLDWLFHAVDEEVPRRFLVRLIEGQLDDRQLSRYAGYGVDLLIRENRHQELLTLALKVGADQLRQHRFDIRMQVKAGSPWWMPGFVDDRIVVQMLDRVERLLLNMAANPKHELRQRYHSQVLEWVTQLKEGQHDEWFGQWRRELMNHPVLQDYLSSLWRELGLIIHHAAENPDSLWRRQMRRTLATFARELDKDPPMQKVLNQWLGDALVAVVSANRHDIASLISDTIGGWDATATAHRIELQIGPDLQYIRINGALVGGLIGVLIHAFTLMWV